MNNNFYGPNGFPVQYNGCYPHNDIPIYAFMDNPITPNTDIIDVDVLHDPILECDTCTKKEVCKFIEKYKKYFDQMESNSTQVKDNENCPFNFHVKCTQYEDIYDK